MIYTVEHRPTGDAYRAWQGMDETTISTLMQPLGYAFEFTTKEAYDAFIAANPSPPGVRP